MRSVAVWQPHLDLGVQLRQAGVLGIQLGLPRLGALLLRRQRRVHLGAQAGPRRGGLLALDLMRRSQLASGQASGCQL